MFVLQIQAKGFTGLLEAVPLVRFIPYEGTAAILKGNNLQLELRFRKASVQVTRHLRNYGQRNICFSDLI